MSNHDARLRKIDTQRRKAHAGTPQHIQVVYYDVDEHGITHYTDAVTGALVDPATIKPIASLANMSMWKALEDDNN